MIIRSFDWDDTNLEHIARHRVEPEEVEEVFSGRRFVFGSRAERYAALGVTATGRHLLVVFRIDSGVMRVITARDMTRAEKRRYRRGA